MRTSCVGALAWLFAMRLTGAAVGEPVDLCGVVETGPLNCLTIRSDAGPVYFPTPRPTGVSAGERVRLIGFNASCSNFCGTTNCVSEAQVSACGGATCRADFDGSGALGVQDIFSFLTAYFAQTTGPSPPSGDFDQNGSLTVGDIFAFLTAYFTGCP